MSAPIFTEQAPHEAGFGAIFASEIAPEIEQVERRRHDHLRQFMVRAFVSAGTLAAIIGVGLALPIPSQTVLKVLPTLVIFGVIVAVIWVRGPYKSYKSNLRSLIVEPVCGFLGELEYTRKPNWGYRPRQFRELGVIPGYRRAEIEDMFEGEHRGTGFRMAEAKLIKGSGRYKTTVFDGLLFEIDVPTSFSCRILIKPNRGRVINGLAEWWARSYSHRLDGREKVSFQDRDFERRFLTYSDDPAEAAQLMAPGFRSTMLDMAKAYRAGWGLSLFRQRRLSAAFDDGKFFLALPAKGNLFEVGSIFRSAYTCETDIRRFMRDLVTARQVIDYLHGDRPRAV